MKRDFDLIRKILFRLEEMDDPRQFDYEIEGNTQEQVNYHLKLLYEAGFIDALTSKSVILTAYLPVSITWEGHDFLESIRNETIWKDVKATVKEKGGGMSFEIVKALAIEGVKKLVGL